MGAAFAAHVVNGRDMAICKENIREPPDVVAALGLVEGGDIVEFMAFLSRVPRHSAVIDAHAVSE